jgi:hypothetical protein
MKRNSSRRSAAVFALALAVTGLPLIMPPAVWAQDENSPEGMAAIKEGEVGRLDRDSVREFGQQMRFEVSIRWGDTGAPKPEAHMTRVVRYVADCKAGSLLLVAVAVIDGSGSRVKTMLSPPGAADPVVPEAGSPQARWLKDVCRS